MNLVKELYKSLIVWNFIKLTCLLFFRHGTSSVRKKGIFPQNIFWDRLTKIKSPPPNPLIKMVYPIPLSQSVNENPDFCWFFDDIAYFSQSFDSHSDLFRYFDRNLFYFEILWWYCIFFAFLWWKPLLFSNSLTKIAFFLWFLDEIFIFPVILLKLSSKLKF